MSAIHGPGGICLIHGYFDGHRCAKCVAREANRGPSLLERVLLRLLRRA